MDIICDCGKHISNVVRFNVVEVKKEVKEDVRLAKCKCGKEHVIISRDNK